MKNLNVLRVPSTLQVLGNTTNSIVNRSVRSIINSYDYLTSFDYGVVKD